jgi:hypothetical protein
LGRLDTPAEFFVDRFGQLFVIIVLPQKASRSQRVGPPGVLGILGCREYDDRDLGELFSFREPRQKLETGVETGTIR